MFNIASIRDSILKKIGTSETGDKTVTDQDAEPINIDGANDSTTIAQTSDTPVQNGHNTTTPTLHPQSPASNLFSVDGKGDSSEDANDSTAIAQTSDTPVQNGHNATTPTLHPQSPAANLCSVDGKGDGSEDANKHQVTDVTDNHTRLENAQCALTVWGDDKNVSNLPENEICHFQKDSVASKQIQDIASDGDVSLPHSDTDVADDVSSTSRHVPASVDTSADMMECDDAAEKLVSGVTDLPPASSLDRQQHEKGEDKTGSLTQPAAATEKTADDIVIKTEIIDKGYEQNLTDPARLSFAEVNENIEGFQNVFVKTENSVVEEDVGESDDVVLVGVGYRNPYSDSEGDSDTDTSSLSSFEFEAPPENKKERQHEEEVVEPRTRGEMYPEDLPPIEDLQISISDKTQLLQIGTVSGIVDILVVIQSTVMAGGHVLPVNEDTVFFFEDRKPFGKVFEVFGPTRSPFYSVRFNSREDIVSKGVDVGLKVYFAPEPAPSEAEITHFVFMNALLKLKGSDASWQDNNEPPPSMVEYSDDEEEKRAKAKRKNAKKQGCGDGDGVNERKRNKHIDGASESGPPSSYRRPRSRQTSTDDSQDPSFDPSQRRFDQSCGRGGFRRGFHGGGPHFSGSHDGQSTQRPPPHTGPSNGTSFLQPSRFSGPGFRMSSGQSPRFSGPPNQVGFQPQAFSGPPNQVGFQPQAFSGPPNQVGFQPQAFSGRGRMPAHQQQAFSGPGNGMPPYQRPPFSGPNGGMLSRPPRMFWDTNNNNNNMHPPQQPHPVFSGHSQQRPSFGQWAPNPPY